MSNQSKSKTKRVVTEVDKKLYLRLKSKLAGKDKTVRAWFEQQMKKEVGNE